MMRRLFQYLIVLCCLGSIGYLAPRARAATLTVTDLSDTGDGTCDSGDSSNGCTLREAITDANSNPDQTKIVFALGLAGGTLTLDSALPDLNSNLSIINPEVQTITIARNTATGTAKFSILTVVDGPTVVLQGLTLTKGTPPAGTGNDSTLGPSSGGGLYIKNSTVALTNCVLSGNTESRSGGGLSNNGGTVTLTNCTVSNNTALFGGGVDNPYGTVTLTNCTVSGNVGEYYGAGLYSSFGTLKLTNCTVANNKMIGNGSNGFGGGLFNDRGTVTLSSCTVTGNTAPANTAPFNTGRGDGIGIFQGSTTLSNSIVVGNTNSDLDLYGSSPNDYASSGYNLVGTSGTNATANFTQAGDQAGVTRDQIKLGPLQNNGGPTQTCAISSDSIAYNAGDPSIAPNSSAFDQRGNPYLRVFGGREDVGAYEAQVQVLRGTVYNAAARSGLSDITITALDASGATVTQTQTDAQGQYALTLPAGVFTLAASKSGDAAYRFLPVFANPVTVTSQSQTTGYNFRVVGIGGRVVSPNNIGVSDVSVNLYAQSDTNRTTPLRSSTSDEQGFFSLDGVAAGIWLVAPVAPTKTYTYTPTSRTITVNNTPVFTSFNAAVISYPVRGRVYNAVAMGGVSGITIKAVRSGSTTVAAQVVTGAQGDYILGLTSGTYTLTASLEGDANYRFTNLFANPVTINDQNPTTGYDFRSIGIGGRIISPSNVGISGVLVGLFAQSDTTFTNPLTSSKSDAQGFFSLDRVAAGTWTVAPIGAYNFTPISRLITVADKAVFTSFTAAALNLVSGKVYNAVALSGLSNILVKAVKSDTPSVMAQFMTDAQGNYTLRLPPGTYTITASRVGDSVSRFLPLFTNPVTTKSTTVTCEFRAIGIGGRVVSPSNVGVSGVTVNLYAQNDTALTTPLTTSTTDAQGFFSLDNVAQGTWIVAPVEPDTYSFTPASRLIQVGNTAVFTSFKASAK